MSAAGAAQRRGEAPLRALALLGDMQLSADDVQTLLEDVAALAEYRAAVRAAMRAWAADAPHTHSDAWTGTDAALEHASALGTRWTALCRRELGRALSEVREAQA